MLEIRERAGEIEIKGDMWNDELEITTDVSFVLDHHDELRLYTWLHERQQGRLSQQPLELNYHYHS